MTQGQAEIQTSLMPWTEVIVLTATSAIFYQVAIFLLRDFFSDTSPLHSTFDSIWLLGVAVALSLSVKSKGVNVGYFVSASFFVGCLLTILLILVPSSLWPIPYYYSGVESRLTYDTYETGFRGTQNQFVDHLDTGDLHSNKCQVLLREAQEKIAYSEHIAFRSFMTWQRGLAEGFHPHSCISEYKYPIGITDWIRIIISIGPLVVVEITVTALSTLFPLMLVAQWILRKRTGEDIWKSWPTL